LAILAQLPGKQAEKGIRATPETAATCVSFCIIRPFLARWLLMEMTTQQITEEANDGLLLVNFMPRLLSPRFSPGHLLPPAGGSFFGRLAATAAR
jgi:hypothetical protein